MGYCDVCGDKAKARCMDCHREICDWHLATSLSSYVSAEDRVAPFYGREPQLRAGQPVTCSDCAHTSDTAIYAKLGQDLQALGEHQAVAWIIALRLWKAVMYGKPERIITVSQYAGLDGIETRPLLELAIESLLKTREPEVLTLHTAKYVPGRAAGMFRTAAPAHTKFAPLRNVTGWLISYEDHAESGGWGSMLIHPNGTATDLFYHQTEFSSGRTVMDPHKGSDRKLAQDLRSKLESPSFTPAKLKMHCESCKVSAAENIARRAIGDRGTILSVYR